MQPIIESVFPAPAAIVPVTGPYTAIWVFVNVPVFVLILTLPDGGAINENQTVFKRNFTCYIIMF